ncbi:MAG: hypothetical protein COV91_04075 [Candidatus Taylorbacteria bacterium CG11_big_fil_rev_8_21_14_0_20_46_11]|uniref:Uncharacterized protein n=1 Tax=Candidatus Taylorbacteria bacterium CG11_big_fil_rev_8_21_14_0_20_46_11 TaxID=1975025 RepID=A0A2H0KCZ2_9BACT|nr:MAG: hypothetical protein COV91_04075 [Candidatus Taylorbacteria bacterium CG11_big_fil_rev_8_21_14_0_20_46_11]
MNILMFFVHTFVSTLNQKFAYIVWLLISSTLILAIIRKQLPNGSLRSRHRKKHRKQTLPAIVSPIHTILSKPTNVWPIPCSFAVTVVVTAPQPKSIVLPSHVRHVIGTFFKKISPYDSRLRTAFQNVRLGSVG